MERLKLSADCDKALLELVKRASKIEKRSVANFIRVVCDEKAKEIISESKKLEVQNDGR